MEIRTIIENENFADDTYYMRIEVDGKPLIADDGFLEMYELCDDTATDDDIASDGMAADNLVCVFDESLDRALDTDQWSFKIRFLIMDFEVFEARYKLGYCDIEAVARSWRDYLFVKELGGIMFVKGGDEHIKEEGTISKYLGKTEDNRVRECSKWITTTWLQYIQEEEEEHRQRNKEYETLKDDYPYAGFPVFAVCSLTKDAVSNAPFYALGTC